MLVPALFHPFPFPLFFFFFFFFLLLLSSHFIEVLLSVDEGQLFILLISLFEVAQNTVQIVFLLIDDRVGRLTDGWLWDLIVAVAHEPLFCRKKPLTGLSVDLILLFSIQGPAVCYGLNNWLLAGSSGFFSLRNVTVEVGMLEYSKSLERVLSGSGTLPRLVLQHLLNQIDGVGACVRNEVSQILPHLRWEVIPARLSQLKPFGPIILGGSSQHFDDFVQLVDFAGSWEEWHLHIQLGHDAAQREYIDRRVVIDRAEQQLWCPVPASGHILREGRSRPNFSRQPEITNLDHIIVDQQIFWLHVSMEESVAVHVSQPTGDLVDDTSE